MKQLVELAMENLSCREFFLFRVCCSECGEEYGSKAIRFSKAGVAPQSSGKQEIYDALYEQEFRQARLLSVTRAAEQLNLCPICRRLVCNRCFLICQDLDMCRSCAARLKEPGNPVFPDLQELAV